MRHLLALILLLAAQINPGPPRGDSLSGLIVGQVVDADGGRPVAGAVVVLAGPAARDGTAHPRILTGSDGRFVYRGLRRGSYQIHASKPGYVDGAHGRTRPAGTADRLELADGERRGDAIVRMWRHASISGTVVDEAGEHLIGARIQAYRRTVISGRQRFVPANASLTDDRGVFRIGGLIPGDYIVGAAIRNASVPLSAPAQRIIAGPQGGGTSAMIPVRDSGYLLGTGTPTPPPSRDGRLQIYPPTFHPNAPGADAASVISLRAGAEYLSADVQLRPVTTVRIAGDVFGPDGPVTMTPLRLVPAHSAEVALGEDGTTTMTDRTGRFAFPAVPTGLYTLRMARAAPASRGVPGTLIWADVPVSAGIEDIEQLTVEAQAGLVVSGRVRFEGSGSQRTPPLSGVLIAIEAADPDSMITGSAQWTARANMAGEFSSPPLPGGRYYVRVPNSPTGWMFKSATAQGRDVADTPMSLAASVFDVDVVFTDRWSGLRGVVRNRDGLDATAAVIVFPTDTDAWVSSGLAPRRVRMVRPGRTGEYALNLPEGDYYVIAVVEPATDDWRDPAFLDAASREAVRVRIVEGERATRDLQTRELR